MQHAQDELRLGPAPLDRAAYLTVFAQLRQRQLRGSEAYDLYAQALELIQSIARKHPLVAYCLDGLGEIDLEHGRLDQSEAHFHESLAVRQAALGESHRQVAYSLDGLARVAAARGKPEEAETLLREASAILERELGSTHPDRIAVASHLRRLVRPPVSDHAAVPARARFLAIPTFLTAGWQVLYIGKDWRIIETNIKRREAKKAKAAQSFFGVFSDDAIALITPPAESPRSPPGFRGSTDRRGPGPGPLCGSGGGGSCRCGSWAARPRTGSGRGQTTCPGHGRPARAARIGGNPPAPGRASRRRSSG